MQRPGNSLVQRNNAASGKHQHRHHKSSEVQFLAVTERMRVSGRPFAPMKALRQRAGSSIDNRVDTLLKHRGASAKQHGGEFRGSDD